MLKRLTFGLFVLLALTLLSLSPASARVYITVTPEGASKVPIAVSEFQPMTIGAAQPPQVAEALPARLNANLDLTGVFITLDQRTFLETNPRAGLSGGQNIDFKEWRAVGAELLVKGAFEISGDGLVLELRLYDVVEGRMLLGKRYTGRLEDGRRMINRFTNEIMYIITGEMGVFGTPIVFVSGAGIDSKRIMMTEFGSDEVKGVKAEGSCTMPVLSKGGRLAYVCRRPGRYDLLAGGKIIHSAPLIVSPCFTPGRG